MKTSLLTSPIGFAVLFGSSGAAPEPAAPVLEVFGGVSQDVAIANGDASPTTADGTDFGLYRSGAAIVNKDFLLVNTGDADLEITDIDVPSGFAIGESFPFTIPAGDDYTLNIETDATPNTSQVWSGDVVIHSTELDDYSFAVTGSTVYSARFLDTSPYDYRQMNEGTGTSIADSSTNAHTAGSATGIAWDALQSPPMGGSVPEFDGTNDYINIYSAGFATGFNFDEFTITIWSKVSGAGVWTDGTARFLIRFSRDGSNEVRIQRIATNNTLRFQRIGGGTTKTIDVGSQSGTGWECWQFSVSIAGNALLGAGEGKVYKNGVQVGSTSTGNLAATNSGLSSTATVIGASNTTPASVYSGYLRDFGFHVSGVTAAILGVSAV